MKSGRFSEEQIVGILKRYGAGQKHSLFNMLNFIVEDQISRPKHIPVLYDQLPEGARQKIEKRDKPPPQS